MPARKKPGNVADELTTSVPSRDDPAKAKPKRRNTKKKKEEEQKRKACETEAEKMKDMAKNSQPETSMVDGVDTSINSPPLSSGELDSSTSQLGNSSSTGQVQSNVNAATVPSSSSSHRRNFSSTEEKPKSRTNTLAMDQSDANASARQASQVVVTPVVSSDSTLEVSEERSKRKSYEERVETLVGNGDHKNAFESLLSWAANPQNGVIEFKTDNVLDPIQLFHRASNAPRLTKGLNKSSPNQFVDMLTSAKLVPFQKIIEKIARQSGEESKTIWDLLPLLLFENGFLDLGRILFAHMTTRKLHSKYKEVVNSQEFVSAVLDVFLSKMEPKWINRTMFNTKPEWKGAKGVYYRIDDQRRIYKFGPPYKRWIQLSTKQVNAKFNPLRPENQYLLLPFLKMNYIKFPHWAEDIFEDMATWKERFENHPIADQKCSKCENMVGHFHEMILATYKHDTGSILCFECFEHPEHFLREWNAFLSPFLPKQRLESGKPGKTDLEDDDSAEEKVSDNTCDSSDPSHQCSSSQIPTTAAINKPSTRTRSSKKRSESGDQSSIGLRSEVPAETESNVAHAKKRNARSTGSQPGKRRRKSVLEEKSTELVDGQGMIENGEVDDEQMHGMPEKTSSVPQKRRSRKRKSSGNGDVASKKGVTKDEVTPNEQRNNQLDSIINLILEKLKNPQFKNTMTVLYEKLLKLAGTNNFTQAMFPSDICGMCVTFLETLSSIDTTNFVVPGHPSGDSSHTDAALDPGYANTERAVQSSSDVSFNYKSKNLMKIVTSIRDAKEKSAREGGKDRENTVSDNASSTEPDVVQPPAEAVNNADAVDWAILIEKLKHGESLSAPEREELVNFLSILKEFASNFQQQPEVSMTDGQDNSNPLETTNTVLASSEATSLLNDDQQPSLSDDSRNNSSMNDKSVEGLHSTIEHSGPAMSNVDKNDQTLIELSVAVVPQTEEVGQDQFPTQSIDNLRSDDQKGSNNGADGLKDGGTALPANPVSKTKHDEYQNKSENVIKKQPGLAALPSSQEGIPVLNQTTTENSCEPKRVTSKNPLPMCLTTPNKAEILASEAKSIVFDGAKKFDSEHRQQMKESVGNKAKEEGEKPCSSKSAASKAEDVNTQNSFGISEINQNSTSPENVDGTEQNKILESVDQDPNMGSTDPEIPMTPKPTDDTNTELPKHGSAELTEEELDQRMATVATIEGEKNQTDDQMVPGFKSPMAEHVKTNLQKEDDEQKDLEETPTENSTKDILDDDEKNAVQTLAHLPAPRNENADLDSAESEGSQSLDGQNTDSSDNTDDQKPPIDESPAPEQNGIGNELDDDNNATADDYQSKDTSRNDFSNFTIGHILQNSDDAVHTRRIQEQEQLLSSDDRNKSPIQEMSSGESDPNLSAAEDDDENNMLGIPHSQNKQGLENVADESEKDPIIDLLVTVPPRTAFTDSDEMPDIEDDQNIDKQSPSYNSENVGDVQLQTESATDEPKPRTPTASAIDDNSNPDLEHTLEFIDGDLLKLPGLDSGNVSQGNILGEKPEDVVGEESEDQEKLSDGQNDPIVPTVDQLVPDAQPNADEEIGDSNLKPLDLGSGDSNIDVNLMNSGRPTNDELQQAQTLSSKSTSQEITEGDIPQVKSRDIDTENKSTEEKPRVSADYDDETDQEDGECCVDSDEKESEMGYESDEEASFKRRSEQHPKSVESEVPPTDENLSNKDKTLELIESSLDGGEIAENKGNLVVTIPEQKTETRTTESPEHPEIVNLGDDESIISQHSSPKSAKTPQSTAESPSPKLPERPETLTPEAGEQLSPDQGSSLGATDIQNEDTMVFNSLVYYKELFSNSKKTATSNGCFPPKSTETTESIENPPKTTDPEDFSEKKDDKGFDDCSDIGDGQSDQTVNTPEEDWTGQPVETEAPNNDHVRGSLLEPSKTPQGLGDFLNPEIPEQPKVAVSEGDEETPSKKSLLDATDTRNGDPVVITRLELDGLSDGIKQPVTSLLQGEQIVGNQGFLPTSLENLQKSPKTLDLGSLPTEENNTQDYKEPENQNQIIDDIDDDSSTLDASEEVPARQPYGNISENEEEPRTPEQPETEESEDNQQDTTEAYLPAETEAPNNDPSQGFVPKSDETSGSSGDSQSPKVPDQPETVLSDDEEIIGNKGCLSKPTDILQNMQDSPKTMDQDILPEYEDVAAGDKAPTSQNKISDFDGEGCSTADIKEKESEERYPENLELSDDEEAEDNEKGSSPSETEDPIKTPAVVAPPEYIANFPMEGVETEGHQISPTTIDFGNLSGEEEIKENDEELDSPSEIGYSSPIMNMLEEGWSEQLANDISKKEECSPTSEILEQSREEYEDVEQGTSPASSHSESDGEPFDEETLPEKAETPNETLTMNNAPPEDTLNSLEQPTDDATPLEETETPKGIPMVNYTPPEATSNSAEKPSELFDDATPSEDFGNSSPNGGIKRPVTDSSEDIEEPNAQMESTEEGNSNNPSTSVGHQSFGAAQNLLTSADITEKQPEKSAYERNGSNQKEETIYVPRQPAEDGTPEERTVNNAVKTANSSLEMVISVIESRPIDATAFHLNPAHKQDNSPPGSDRSSPAGVFKKYINQINSVSGANDGVAPKDSSNMLKNVINQKERVDPVAEEIGEHINQPTDVVSVPDPVEKEEEDDDLEFDGNCGEGGHTPTDEDSDKQSEPDSNETDEDDSESDEDDSDDDGNGDPQKKRLNVAEEIRELHVDGMANNDQNDDASGALRPQIPDIPDPVNHEMDPVEPVNPADPVNNNEMPENEDDFLEFSKPNFNLVEYIERLEEEEKNKNEAAKMDEDTKDVDEKQEAVDQDDDENLEMEDQDKIVADPAAMPTIADKSDQKKVSPQMKSTEEDNSNNPSTSAGHPCFHNEPTILNVVNNVRSPISEQNPGPSRNEQHTTGSHSQNPQSDPPIPMASNPGESIHQAHQNATVAQLPHVSNTAISESVANSTYTAPQTPAQYFAEASNSDSPNLSNSPLTQQTDGIHNSWQLPNLSPNINFDEFTFENTQGTSVASTQESDQNMNSHPPPQLPPQQETSPHQTQNHWTSSEQQNHWTSNEQPPDFTHPARQHLPNQDVGTSQSDVVTDQLQAVHGFGNCLNNFDSGLNSQQTNSQTNYNHHPNYCTPPPTSAQNGESLQSHPGHGFGGQPTNSTSPVVSHQPTSSVDSSQMQHESNSGSIRPNSQLANRHHPNSLPPQMSTEQRWNPPPNDYGADVSQRRNSTALAQEQVPNRVGRSQSDATANNIQSHGFGNFSNHVGTSSAAHPMNTQAPNNYTQNQSYFSPPQQPFGNPNFTSPRQGETNSSSQGVSKIPQASHHTPNANQFNPSTSSGFGQNNGYQSQRPMNPSLVHTAMPPQNGSRPLSHMSMPVPNTAGPAGQTLPNGPPLPPPNRQQPPQHNQQERLIHGQQHQQFLEQQQRIQQQQIYVDQQRRNYELYMMDQQSQAAHQHQMQNGPPAQNAQQQQIRHQPQNGMYQQGHPQPPLPAGQQHQIPPAGYPMHFQPGPNRPMTEQQFIHIRHGMMRRQAQHHQMQLQFPAPPNFNYAPGHGNIPPNGGFPPNPYPMMPQGANPMQNMQPMHPPVNHQQQPQYDPNLRFDEP